MHSTSIPAGLQVGLTETPGSCNDNPDVKELATQAGANLYIVKPGPVNKLELAVVKFCGGAQEPE